MSSPESARPGPVRTVVISCQVLQDLLVRLLPEGLAAEVTFMDYGLHRVPSQMTGTLQEHLDAIEEPSLVVLGYGLCGNGLKGLKAGKHTLLVPRVDDCIALLLGSYRTYMREFQATPGTYYLSKGWLESGSHPLKEYKEYLPKYGSKEAMWLMDQQYQHYERLVLVAHDPADLEAYRPQAQEVARFCERWGMRYEEVLGSDAYVRRLVEVAVALDQADGDFLVIPPGGEIRQDQFMR
ncbi:MAG: DUF1638 domain-containing protein [Anaerolineae bacterium]